MPSAARLDDLASDHDGAPPTPCIGASPDVSIDGRPAVRQGDPFGSHARPDESDHARSLAGGSGSVFINGKPAGRIGDPISCGGQVAEGSDTVSIGD
ncbi:PAAR domain-containing protein [Bordetella genomosp. 13]|uniref:Type VI secretion system PAAR protein n=1 Tax=Bordetella genomosp. 13 TaxID=463040 RepID=A0A1W6ZI68_9BORD|nr:PAAR domain-containing protein [Bordetella genomosp. 13]ARP97108.1 hypothetical protein CAL15_23660 [Bordetella genomosp. 13]